MRLRYFRVQNYPPIRDISLSFSAESPLQRECAIRFVVGVNGTGKTHLLQALTETFIALARQKPPHFPVTLIYELGYGKTRRTLIFDNPGNGQNEGWWQSVPGMPLLPPDFRKSDWRSIIEQPGELATIYHPFYAPAVDRFKQNRKNNFLGARVLVGPHPKNKNNYQLSLDDPKYPQRAANLERILQLSERWTNRINRKLERDISSLVAYVIDSLKYKGHPITEELVREELKFCNRKEMTNGNSCNRRQTD